MTAILQCKKCNSTDFSPNGVVNGKTKMRCRPCHNARNRLYDRIDPTKSKERRYKYAASGKYRLNRISRIYNLDKKSYISILENQNNACAICKKQETVVDKRNGFPRNLAVDHCHITNKVRGLLCGRCNKGLGLFKEDFQALKNAVSYLEINLD